MENSVKTAIILASSRINGNTHQLAQLYMQHRTCDLFNLTDYVILPFDYQHKNQHDDFLTLIKVLLTYDHLIFATPVYWYAMSAQLKTFVDRLSDLVTIEKSLGRALKGKYCSVLATGSNIEVPACFISPFKLSAHYLAMNFIGCFYCCCPEGFNNQKHNDYLKRYLASKGDSDIEQSIGKD